MINKKIGVLLLFALLISFGAKAQRATSMRINEVLVINEDNFVDDYGKRHGWIELFNTSAGTVNIAGCYLTDDKNNPMKYPIPKGDFIFTIDHSTVTDISHLSGRDRNFVDQCFTICIIQSYIILLRGI